MRALRLGVGALATLSLGSFAWGAGPTINQALEVLRAESSCQLADPSTVFSAPLLRDLTRLQLTAKHEPAQEMMDGSSDYLDHEYVFVRRIRSIGKYDLADVYRARCLSYPSWRQAVARLKPGEIFVVENFAWVALLAEGEYFGAGLSFIKTGDDWRFSGISSDYLGSSPRVEPLLRQMHAQSEYVERDASQCSMPEAPERSEALLKAKLDALEAEEAKDSDVYYDEHNALAVAMRNSVRYYAEGKQTPPLPIAQLMMAEILLRSLGFSRAPESDTKTWAARVERAAMFLDRAQARGVNLDRVAPLLSWLGQVYWHGVGEIHADQRRGKNYLDLAARWGDEEAVAIIRQLPLAPEDGFEPDYLPRPNRQFAENVAKELVRCQ